MKVVVVYCYPLVLTNVYFGMAKRFADTWKQFPPGHSPHELVVVCNGGNAGPMDRAPFDGIPCTFYGRNNAGWDIGAFQQAADEIPCDLMVCLGAPVHFYRPGWLDRMVWSFLEHSPGLFGCWGVPYRDIPHIRTTAFWFQPELMKAYPFVVGTQKASRYAFEHGGKKSFTEFCRQAGYEPLMVTFENTYRMNQWEQSDGSVGKCLVFDQWTHQ